MELFSIVGKPVGVDKSDSQWGQAKCSPLTPIMELWASFTALWLMFSLFLNCYRCEQSIKAVRNPYKYDGQIVILLSIREQGIASTTLFFKCIFISIKVKEESLYRGCLWNTFSRWQCVNVTWWVPSPRSVISLGGVFVAQGSLAFSVTAASLVTTPSLPVKVRLLLHVQHQTGLWKGRQLCFPGQQPKQCSQQQMGKSLLCSTGKSSYILILQF